VNQPRFWFSISIVMLITAVFMGLWLRGATEPAPQSPIADEPGWGQAARAGLTCRWCVHPTKVVHD
jgi:hypothetical protein